MSSVSVLTGEVIDGIPVEYGTLHGEKFYTIKVKFRTCEIKVLISEHTMLEEYGGVISVTGYLATFKVKEENRKYEYVFVGTKIEQAELDSPLTNQISFNYKVTRVEKLDVNGYGVEVLTLYASFYTPFKTTSIVKLCAKSQAARVLNNREPGFYISGQGYLKSYKDTYEIIITDISDTAE